MHTPPDVDARQLRTWMQAIHDAVSFALPHGDCGIEFRWEIFGFDLDPDLSFDLRFTATCLDPRVDRTLLTGSRDGDKLLDSDVQAANERLRPFGLVIIRSTVEEVKADDGGAAVRVRFELAVEPPPLTNRPTLTRSLPF
jgi:hypothetical protein